MTTLLLLLSLVLAVGIGTAVTLRRLLHMEPAGPARGPAGEPPALIRSGPQTYQPMTRLFAEEDFGFISRWRPGLLGRLRRQRKQVLRLYLRQLRLDFQRVYAFCRLLAPKSADPNFAALITRQALSFYGLLLILHLRCTFGWFLHVRVDAADLVGAFDRLRQTAQEALSAMTPQPALAGNPA